MSNRKLIKEVWITDAVGEEGSGFFFNLNVTFCILLRLTVVRFVANQFVGT